MLYILSTNTFTDKSSNPLAVKFCCEVAVLFATVICKLCERVMTKKKQRNKKMNNNPWMEKEEQACCVSSAGSGRKICQQHRCTVQTNTPSPSHSL